MGKGFNHTDIVNPNQISYHQIREKGMKGKKPDGNL
jgi:hypothetical protein